MPKTEQVRMAIANVIRDLRIEAFPGYGGSIRCANAFKISPQQWSPWERGSRTPNSVNMAALNDLFSDKLGRDIDIEDIALDSISSIPDSDEWIENAGLACLEYFHSFIDRTSREISAKGFEDCIRRCIQEAKTSRSRTQWHPASEPPEPFKTVNVAVCRDGNNIARIRDTAIFDNSGESGGRWRLGEYAGQPGYTVTHWADLLPMPEDVK